VALLFQQSQDYFLIDHVVLSQARFEGADANAPTSISNLKYFGATWNSAFDPIGDSKTVPHEHTREGALLRAERHRYPDVARPLRDGVGDHAVNADNPRQQDDGCEHGQMQKTPEDVLHNF